MPTAVAFPEIAATFKLAMVEHLAPLFDDAAHILGGVSINFPLVRSFIFDPHGLKELTGLVIAITGTNPINQRNQHVTNPQYPGRPGVEVWADMISTVRIIGPVLGGVSPSNRETVDKAWAALYAAFTCGQTELAARGIHQPEMPVIGEDAVSDDPTRIEIIGILSCKVSVALSTFTI